MANYNLDLCDNEKCQFSGICKRFLPRDKVPKGQYRWYITDCTNYVYFVQK